MKKIVLILFFATFAFSATLPSLKGRVTDDANILGQNVETILTQKIKEIEKQNNVYLVVATVNSLDGDDIADYGVKLGRHWGIGEKGKDNGIVLLIAPNERKVNISTGYGIEGVLTDAIASNIIQDKILPEFKASDYEQGVLSGVDSINLVLSGEYDTMKMMNKYMKHFYIIQLSYPKNTGFDITSYTPREIFVTLFIFSFLFMMASTMFKSTLPFVAAGFSAVYTFVIMIFSFLLGGIITSSANYFLLALYIVFVVFFTYKNRNYKPD